VKVFVKLPTASVHLSCIDNCYQSHTTKLHFALQIIPQESPVRKIEFDRIKFEKCNVQAFSSHIISLHGIEITLLFFCRRYGVHYRLLATCVGSFTCPGIDALVQGVTVFSLIRQTLFVLTTYSSMCPGRDRTRSLPLLGL
jgi:hypothetical protein